MPRDAEQSCVDDVADDARFWRKVKVVSDCWEWQGYRDRQGYGHVLRNGHNYLAHRYAFAQMFGPPTGVVRHSCDNPPCINPGHLIDGTQAENIADRQARKRHRPGRFPGEAHPSHRLTDAIVREARGRRADGASVKSLAADYGVAYGWMQRILTGKAWSHIKDDAA